MTRKPGPFLVPRLPGGESAKALEAEGWRLWRAGQLLEAEQHARRSLVVNSKSPTALFLLGNIARDKGDREAAESWYRRCIKIWPSHFGAHANLGGLLLFMGRRTEALACYHAALKIAPNEASLHYNLGQCLRSLGQYEKAIMAYRRALELKPDFVVAACDLATLMALSGKNAEAEALCRELTIRHPLAPEPRLSLGAIYRDRGRLGEARLELEEVIRLVPQHRQGLLDLAALLIDLGEFRKARGLIDAAARAGAARAALLILTAELRARQGDYQAAVEFMSQTIAKNGGRPEDYLKLAAWHAANNDRVRAVAVLEEGMKIHGDTSPQLLVTLFYNQLCLGDWRHYRQRLSQVLAVLRGPTPPLLEPFIALQIPGLGPRDICRITQVYAQPIEKRAGSASLPAGRRHGTDGRLRIGYISSDFHEHATAYLTAGVFEHHDTDHFAVHAYSYGPDDQSPTRARLKGSFERFTDIRHLAHRAAAELISMDAIDILVDLKGYTRLARPEILAPRPAPIQVNWLGYPGTMGADFMDYIIVDPTVAPPVDAPAYREALAYLPHTYAPLDLKRTIATPPSRGEVGLPEEGFVFCCFNNPRKILPDFFHCWCRLLAAVPDSVLWLFARQAAVIENMRREAKRQAINPERIVFASRLTQGEHLARLTLADLILDTLPYNAHTTTADALFVGVPVLTCQGETFAGRVATSLLRAAGMPDMVTHDLEAYQARALHLASHREEVSILRKRLTEARIPAPYFDTVRFTKDLEALYQRMWARHEAGLTPALLPPLAWPLPDVPGPDVRGAQGPLSFPPT